MTTKTKTAKQSKISLKVDVGRVTQPKVTTVKVEATKHPTLPFAWHDSATLYPNSKTTAFHVTHVPSGLSIFQFLPSEQDAIEAIELFASLFPIEELEKEDFRLQSKIGADEQTRNHLVMLDKTISLVGKIIEVRQAARGFGLSSESDDSITLIQAFKRVLSV